jgi:hypothetical protein
MHIVRVADEEEKAITPLPRGTNVDNHGPKYL